MLVKAFLLKAIIFGLCAPLFAREITMEAQGGVLAANASVAPAYGLRINFISPTWEKSLGYWSARGIHESSFVSGGLDLHVLSAEAYRIFYANQKLNYKLGGGIGFAIPNLDGGASETADNGHSWVAGGGADYELTKNISIGATLKWFFFSTEAHVTTYTTKTETLLIDGVPSGPVEVVEVSHHDNRVKLDSVLLMVALRWR